MPKIHRKLEVTFSKAEIQAILAERARALVLTRKDVKRVELDGGARRRRSNRDAADRRQGDQVMAESKHSAFVERLLKIADSTDAPDHSDRFSGPTEFAAIDGWTVYLHYRGNGDLNYIDRFVDPDGADLDFWDGPSLLAEDSDALIAWNGVRTRKRPPIVTPSDDEILAMKATIVPDTVPEGMRRQMQDQYDYLHAEIIRRQVAIHGRRAMGASL